MCDNANMFHASERKSGRLGRLCAWYVAMSVFDSIVNARTLVHILSTRVLVEGEAAKRQVRQLTAHATRTGRLGRPPVRAVVAHYARTVVQDGHWCVHATRPMTPSLVAHTAVQDGHSCECPQSHN